MLFMRLGSSAAGPDGKGLAMETAMTKAVAQSKAANRGTAPKALDRACMDGWLPRVRAALGGPFLRARATMTILCSEVRSSRPPAGRNGARNGAAAPEPAGARPQSPRGCDT